MSSIHENASPRRGFSLAAKLALLMGGFCLLMTAAFTVFGTLQMREETTTNYHQALEAIVRVREGLLMQQYDHVEDLVRLIAEAQALHPHMLEQSWPLRAEMRPKSIEPDARLLGKQDMSSFAPDQDVASIFVGAEGRGAQQVHRLLEATLGELPFGALLVFLDKRSVVLAPAAWREQELPVTIPAGHLAQASISRRVHAWHGEQGSYLYRVFYFAPQEWYVACFMPLSPLEEVLARRLWQVLGMGLLLTLLGIVLAYWFGRQFTAPLCALDRAARALPTLPIRGDILLENGEENVAAPSRGVCSVASPVLPPSLPRLLGTRGDEVKALVGSFECMVQQLQTNVRSMLALRQAQAREQSELQWARAIQDSLLPREFPSHPSLDVHGCVLPAREVCGDFYDVFMLDDRHCCFAVGNVRDKGVPAAVAMSMILSLTRSLVRQRQPSSSLAQSEIPRVAAVLTQVNAALCRDNSCHMFATIILGVLDCTTGVMVWANAGHPAPLRFRPEPFSAEAAAEASAEAMGNAAGENGKGTPPKKIHNEMARIRVEVLPTRQEMVAGGLEEAEYSPLTCTLNPGDRVMLYTDGVSEALREDGARFGTPPAYLEGVPLSARAVNWRIVKKIQMFVAGAPQPDDITLLNFLWRGPQS